MRLFLPADIAKARKLHGKMEFQGLPISVENRAGSHRHWYDPNADEHGSTEMKYPYGYIRGTLGLDGDAVDVFVGPEESSTKVFIVTQLKSPEFKEIDEQKVMLGFKTATDAKKAYLDHYTDSRFFGSMKEFTLEEFREKLQTHKGKLIKNLFIANPSAIIQQVDWLTQKDSNMDINKACDHSKSTTCSKCEDKGCASDMLKALTSRMLSTLQRHKTAVQEREAAAKQPPELPAEFDTQEISLLGSRKFETPITPTGHIATPAPSASPLSPDFMTSCDGCGYTHKSLSACPRCAGITASNREALPIWRR